ISLTMLVSAVHARTFTDATGRTLEAEIVEYSGGDSVTIRRDDGQQFTLPLDRLSTADQEYIRAWKPAERTAASPDDIQRINSRSGAELFADGDLWDDDPTQVATRLGWPAESQTDTQASYRRYHAADDRYFGARPYSPGLSAQSAKADM